MNLQFNALTDVGRKRSKNQDQIGAFPELGLFIVADGMGGHRGGETASQMAVETICEYTAAAFEASQPWNPRRVLTDAIQKANHLIFERSANDPELHGMGTTAIAALVRDETLTLGHVGDSRCYLLRDGFLWQVTRDHSLVQEKIRAGLITREEAKTDRMKNVITRSVGFEGVVSVEIYESDLLPGDLFLLCSDGLSGQLTDAELQEILNEGRETLDACTETLIRRANANGGDDNISAILVEVT